jgi:hypothetical protein
MAVTNAAQSAVKTVADPNAAYESLSPLWQKCRAVCSGEQYVKDFDANIDVLTFKNLLIPFSPSMSQAQYKFYKAEAELPGITAQFAKMIIGGLLRKKPLLELPDGMPGEAYEWIINEFGKDDSPLVAFLDAALWEEVQTSRAWIFVDYPVVENAESYTKEELLSFKPYPVLRKAEQIVNWRVSENQYGKAILDRVIVRVFEESYDENEFHPTFKDTVYVHELIEGKYQIRKFQRSSNTTIVPVIGGAKQNVEIANNAIKFDLVDTFSNIMANGEPISIIPAWPLNGSIELVEPMLAAIIDKEISLYNKISRRNHLLYGAATYTPVIISDMTDEEFDEIVSGGLGTWLRLRQGDDAKVLETPTAALQDMDRAIASSIEEMAKLGIRMLSPETEQSGVALEIRNAAQTAQLGTLNNKVSNIMAQVIVFMLNWRYDLQLRVSEIEFSLSTDFNPVPLGADWLRLATEWYQQGLLPRSVWLVLLKQNDLVSPDYNDEEAIQEITADKLLIPTDQNAENANAIGANNAP